MTKIIALTIVLLAVQAIAVFAGEQQVYGTVVCSLRIASDMLLTHASHLDPFGATVCLLPMIRFTQRL
jgi:hypothetical protein